MPAPRLTERCARSKLRLISWSAPRTSVGGHPVRRGVTVDVERQRLAVAHRDRGAVGDRLVDGGGDLVVALQRDALVREDLADRVTGRGHVLDVAVHVQGHRRAHRGVSDRGADHRCCGDRRGTDQRCLALADACELLAHISPDVVLSGPRGWHRALSHASAEAGGTTSTQGAALSESGHGAGRDLPIPANSHQTIRRVPCPPKSSSAISGRREQRLAVRNPPESACSAYQAPPKAASVFASIASHSTVRSSPRTPAMARTVTGTRYDALGRPR